MSNFDFFLNIFFWVKVEDVGKVVEKVDSIFGVD